MFLVYKKNINFFSRVFFNLLSSKKFFHKSIKRKKITHLYELFLVAKMWFEHMTLRVWTECSSQLSYFAVIINVTYYNCSFAICQDKKYKKFKFLVFLVFTHQFLYRSFFFSSYPLVVLKFCISTSSEFITFSSFSFIFIFIFISIFML